MNDKYIDCMNCANKENCDNYQSHKDESGRWEREQDSCSKYQEVESNNTTSNKSNKKDKNKPSINSLPARQRKPLFDVVIGNPPYQSSTIGENDSYAPPVYHEFIDASAEIAEKALLVHPARFLFNAGSTPKQWNKKMLHNEHFSILEYEPNSKKFFPNTDIKGGIVVSLSDNKKKYKPIEVFTSFQELNTILQKVKNHGFESLMNVIYVQNRYLLDVMFKDHPECKINIGSDGKDRRFRSNAFEKIHLFSPMPQNPDDIKVIGVIDNKRVWRYIPRKYFDFNHENINKWKVLTPAANGSGALGEIVSTPLIGEPLIGYTQTFIGIGAFETKQEAENCMKYIKTKFCRTMLGILKITQSNNKETWEFVPEQDFTNTSDVPWNKSISEIDKYLYKKYGLSEEEINFIETKVKEMK